MSINMAVSAEVLISELNKVNKKDLINILVYRKVPSNVTLNDTLSDYFNKLCLISGKDDKIEDELFHDTADDIVYMCDKPKCIKNSVQCEAYRNEVLLLKTTIHHLEGRIKDQGVIIDLLQINDNRIANNNKQHFSGPSQPSSGLTTNAKRSDKNNSGKDNGNCKYNREPNQVNCRSACESGNRKVSDNVKSPSSSSSRVMQNALSTVNGQQQQKPKITLHEVNSAVNDAVRNTLRPFSNLTVRNRKPIIGSSLNSSVTAVPKRGYLHVYRLSPQTSADALLQYLKGTAPEIDFTCESLYCGDKSSSFKVSFPIERVNDVYEPNIWPTGSCVRRFIFKKSTIINRNQNFLQNASLQKNV